MEPDNINNEIQFQDANNISMESKTDATADNVVINPKLFDRSHRIRVWVAVFLSCICYVITSITLSPICIQYFSYRIAKDEYGIKFNSTKHSCLNSTNSSESDDNKVQKEVSLFIVNTHLASGIPAIFVTILIGSYSDFIGRKPILLAATVGFFFRIFILMLIVKLDWNINLYYIGVVVDGFSGSYFGLIMAATAMITDNTPDAKDRGLNFAIIEGVLVPTAAASQVAMGYLIKEEGYFLPMLIMCALMAISLAVAILFLPETMQYKRKFNWDPRIHIKKVVGFYLFTQNTKKRLLYVLGLGAFVILSMTNVGRQNVETLFELAYPLCWDSAEIGTFMAIRMVGSALIAMLFMRLMKNCISPEMIAFACTVSTLVGAVMFGLSTKSFELYIAAIVGCLYLGCLPIVRATMSQLTSPMEQGAMFSSLSVVETISNLASSTIFTYVYNTTLDSFNGAVFMIVAALLFFCGVFIIAFRFVRGHTMLADYAAMVNTIEQLEHIAGDDQNKDKFQPSPTDVVTESTHLLQ